MPMNCKVSFIIPTFNEEKYLPFLLASIKNQEVDFDYEIIVADNYSSDNTVALAQRFGAKVVAGGLPAKGRNEGAKASQGELLFFIDADLILPSRNFLKEALEEMEKNNLDGVSFLLWPLSKIDRPFHFLYNSYIQLVQKFWPHPGGAILVKKEAHQKIGGFNEEIKFAEDDYYFQKIKKAGFKIKILNKKILSFSRRFEKDGRLATYLKYLLAEIYMIFFGPIKKEIFNYSFGYPETIFIKEVEKIKTLKIINNLNNFFSQFKKTSLKTFKKLNHYSKPINNFLKNLKLSK